MDDDRIRWVPSSKQPKELISLKRTRQRLVERGFGSGLVEFVGDSPPTIGRRGEFVNIVYGGSILKAELAERTELAKAEATHAFACGRIGEEMGSGKSKLYRVEKRDPCQPIRGPLVIEEGLSEFWQSSEPNHRFLQKLILDREEDPTGRWFYALDLQSLPGKPVDKKGRPPAPYWANAEKTAMLWLQENGYPQPGDGGQAQLEKHVAEVLAADRYYPGESTVREHVSQWIAEYKQSVNA